MMALFGADPSVLAVPRSIAEAEENELGDSAVIANMNVSIEP